MYGAAGLLAYARDQTGQRCVLLVRRASWTQHGGTWGPPGGDVLVVTARGSGDDTIAALAAKTDGRRLVVTADRELRRRCMDAGAAVTGPRWLLSLL